MKVFVADDDVVFRTFIQNALAAHPGFEVVGFAVEVEEAIELIHKMKPEMVLMNIHLPRHGGLEATRRLKKELPLLSVVITSELDGQAYRNAAERAGADGFLLKIAPLFRIPLILREAQSQRQANGQGANRAKEQQ